MLKVNKEAVSPVIGVILMVAITVIVAAVVAVFGFEFTGDFGGASPKPPTAAITVENVPATIGIVDMKLTHRSGDRLRAGDWWLSIVPVGQPPAYHVSITDFKVGDMITTTNLTNGDGVYTITNSTVSCTGCSSISLISDRKYDVKIIVYPFKNMVLDKVVEVR